MHQQFAGRRQHYPDILGQRMMVQDFGFLQDHFGITDDGIERRAEIVANLRLNLDARQLRKVGLAGDQPVDQAVQLLSGGPDPFEIRHQTGQAEIARLLGQQFVKSGDRTRRPSEVLRHMCDDRVALEFVLDTHLSQATGAPFTGSL
jgi:hypothetical protein